MRRILSASTLLPVSLLALVTAVSISQAANRHSSYQSVGMLSGTLVLYLAVLWSVADSTAIDRIFKTVVVAGAIVATYGILQHWQIAPLVSNQYGERNPGSLMGLTNFAAEALIVPFAMSLALGFTAQTRSQRLLFATGFLTMVYYLIIAENRGSWVGVAAGALAGFIVYARLSKLSAKMIITRLLAAGMVLCLILFVVIRFTDSGERFARRAMSIFDPSHPTIRTRLLIWRAAIESFKDSPILGVGFANADVVIPKYVSRELEQLFLESGTKMGNVHNEYLQLLLECGIVGVLPALILMAYMISITRRRAATLESSKEHWQLSAVVSGLIGLLTCGMFGFPLRNLPSALYFWLCVGLLEVQGNGRSRRSIEELAAPGNMALHRVRALLLFAMAGWFSYLTYFAGRNSKADLAYNIAHIYSGIQQPDQVVRYATKAITLNPHQERYYYGRAMAYERLGQLREAARDLESSIRESPNFQRAYFHLGTIYYRLGEFDRAKDALVHARLLLKSKPADVASTLVAVYIELGDFTNAVEMAKEAAAAEPGNATHYYNLAFAYFRSGLYDNAADQCRKALSLDPNLSPARLLLDQIGTK